MTEGTDAEIAALDDVTERRDEIVSQVTAHAGRIARELALLRGGDFGQSTFDTAAGTWTLKYDGGDLQYLRFEGNSGQETYVVSTRQPPEPDELADAMADYAAFVEAYNRYVASLDGVLDDVTTEFPDVASTESVASERDRIVARIRDVANGMAGELHRADGGSYGTYATRVDGKRWELKWEGDVTSYLRVGGEGGTYLLSQYEPPSVSELVAMVDDVAAFVEAFNEHVSGLDEELATVSL